MESSTLDRRFSGGLFYSNKKRPLLGSFFTHKSLKRYRWCYLARLAVQIVFELVMIIYQGRRVRQALFETFSHNQTHRPGFPQLPL